MEKHGRYSYTPFVVYFPFSSPRPPSLRFCYRHRSLGRPSFLFGACVEFCSFAMHHLACLSNQPLKHGICY